MFYFVSRAGCSHLVWSVIMTGLMTNDSLNHGNLISSSHISSLKHIGMLKNLDVLSLFKSLLVQMDIIWRYLGWHKWTSVSFLKEILPGLLPCADLNHRRLVKHAFRVLTSWLPPLRSKKEQKAKLEAKKSLLNNSTLGNKRLFYTLPRKGHVQGEEIEKQVV